MEDKMDGMEKAMDYILDLLWQAVESEANTIQLMAGGAKEAMKATLAAFTAILGMTSANTGMPKKIVLEALERIMDATEKEREKDEED